MAEKLCLQWNDFRENAISAFGSLKEVNDFADVTLACGDGEQVEAHKVILAASSPFFQNLLRKNVHAHPLIYMRGVKAEELSAIIDFLYCGEANVYQENLDSFLAIAEELQIKGLMGKPDADEGEQKKPSKMPEKEKQVQRRAKVGSTANSNLDRALALTSNFSGNWQDLDKKCNTMMEKTLKRKENGNLLYKCKVCGKEEICSGLKHHIEANHLEGISIPCNFCEKIFRSRNALGTHIHSNHKDQ